MPIAVLEAGEQGAILVFAVFGTTMPVSSSKERWQLVMPFSELDSDHGTTQCPVAERSKPCEGWAVSTLETYKDFVESFTISGLSKAGSLRQTAQYLWCDLSARPPCR